MADADDGLWVVRLEQAGVELTEYIQAGPCLSKQKSALSTSEWAWASRRDQTRDKHLHTHVCAASTRQHVVGYTHLLLPELTTHACDVHQLLNAQKLDRFRSVSEAMTAEKLLGSFHEFIQSSFVPYYYNLGSNPNQRVILAFFFKKKINPWWRRSNPRFCSNKSKK